MKFLNRFWRLDSEWSRWARLFPQFGRWPDILCVIPVLLVPENWHHMFFISLTNFCCKEHMELTSLNIFYWIKTLGTPDYFSLLYPTMSQSKADISRWQVSSATKKARVHYQHVWCSSLLHGEGREEDTRLWWRAWNETNKAFSEFVQGSWPWLSRPSHF